MIIVIISLVFIAAVSLYSATHALGIWLVLMITHGYLVDVLGPSTTHLPLAVGLVILVSILLNRQWSIVQPRLLLLLSSLFAVMSIAAISGLDPELSLGRIIWYSKGFLLALMIAGTIKTEEHIRLLTLYCLVGVAVGVFVTLNEWITGDYAIQTFAGPRAGRLTSDPNSTAMLLLTGIPLTVFWMHKSRRRSIAILSLVTIGLIVAGITLTHSRGGFVSMAIIFVVLYLRNPTLKAGVSGLAVLAAVFVLGPASSDYWNRVETLVASQEYRGGSINNRIQYVTTGVEIFLDNPGLGVGMGNFGKALIATNPGLRDDDPGRVAHNMYLEFFVENGIFGGLLLLAILASALLAPIRFDREHRSVASPYGLGFCTAVSLFSIMVSGLFLSLGKTSVLWFLVGICLAFTAIPRPTREAHFATISVRRPA